VIKTLVQCDFDGTITEEDVSYLLLDTFADGNWRRLLRDYMDGKMPVGTFNRQAFAMVKADKQALLDFVFQSGRVKIRPGFNELLNNCSAKGFKFVIVSNGLIFYIEAILENMGVKGIEVFAAQNRFSPEGMKVKYVGPDGSQMEAGFKEAYTELFQKKGYSIVYVGNGISDIYPARRAIRVFATGDLLSRCRETELECTPFDDLNDVVRGLETLSLS
jgi:2-hydroxy-3-keto-5-methylthiopentenyl-1-phosphate phosphatase